MNLSPGSVAGGLPVDASATTAGKSRECCTRFVLGIEGKNPGGGGWAEKG